MMIEIHTEADGGITLTVPHIPGLHAEGDDLCEAVKNLAAALAIHDVDASEIRPAGSLTIHTARDMPGGIRETVTVYVEPYEPDDPRGLLSLVIVSLGMQMCVQPFSPETMTRIGLHLIDSAALAAKNR